ncbi:MAG: MFS transporter [Candidatus Lambdaproteobacteria bacterium]|nr:MFS transporter [Candidatus Lambdaproteobacteria bacterium]
MPPERRIISRTVLLLGIASLFTDVGSEMVFPLLPIFLAETLRASPTYLGLIEGAADAVASLLKLVSGVISDHVGRRKGLVLFGYGIASVVRPFMAAAAAPWHVLTIRLTDRVGKGIRTSPRDALIAGAVGDHGAGRAFGFHRAMDHAGAVLGPLVATGLLAWGLGLRAVFWLTAAPGALAMLAIALVREPPRPAAVAAGGAGPTEPATTDSGERLTGGFYGYLGILALFSLGNSSDAFLLLRARELGLATAAIPLLWTGLHVSKMVCSFLGGALADRYPRAVLIVAGWSVYALVYVLLGIAQAPWQVWALFLLYGVYYGLTEPTEKALVKEQVPANVHGRAFGLYNFVVGFSALPAGLLTGWLWDRFGARPALGAGAALAAGAAALLLGWNRGRAAPGRTG